MNATRCGHHHQGRVEECRWNEVLPRCHDLAACRGAKAFFCSGAAVALFRWLLRQAAVWQAGVAQPPALIVSLMSPLVHL